MHDIPSKISDHREHFARLASINVSLTNKCNLRCQYCYEQHDREYGKFDVDTVQRIHDFLLNINDISPMEKNIVFFGGEPMLQSDIILQYLETNPVIKTAMVSNCTLLTPEFIGKYFSYTDTRLIMSIDTFQAEVDNRHGNQSTLDKIKESIEHIPLNVRLDKRVIARPTVSLNNAMHLTSYLREMWALGIRSFIIQPLIMSASQGFVNWTHDEWGQFIYEVFAFFKDHPEMDLEVTEGVGNRQEGSNCLVNYDIISVDAQGDFSGCYFFVNKKDVVGDLLSGNILTDKIYVEREKYFQDQYLKMWDVYEECKTCPYNGMCYQCPAGNLDTGKVMFRPDGMCKRFVQFYLMMQEAARKFRV